MKRFRFLISTLFLLSFTVTTYSQIIAIRTGSVIDPESGTAATNQVIIIEKGRIKAVGRNLAVPATLTSSLTG